MLLMLRKTILRSLKKAAPLLVQVGFFVGFFWVLFGIIGIQTFRGSYRRQCVWEGNSPRVPANLRPAGNTAEFYATISILWWIS